MKNLLVAVFGAAVMFGLTGCATTKSEHVNACCKEGADCCKTVSACCKS